MPKPTITGNLYSGSTVAQSADVGCRVYVIDDESEVRRSLHFVLSTAGLVSWPFASASDFLENLANLEPAPILLDIRMPEVDGIQLLSVLRERGIDWPVIIISAHGDIRVAVDAIKLGAIEFLEKPFEFEDLETCLQTAFAQLSAESDSLALRKAARSKFDLLSPRESEVVNILMQGVPNKSAAHILSLSVRTIEMHRANALAKLGVKSLAEVIRLAGTAGLNAILPNSEGKDDGA